MEPSLHLPTLAHALSPVGSLIVENKEIISTVGSELTESTLPILVASFDGTTEPPGAWHLIKSDSFVDFCRIEDG